MTRKRLLACLQKNASEDDYAYLLHIKFYEIYRTKLIPVFYSMKN
jgi:hypothetical protein